MAYLANDFMECVSYSTLVCGWSIASTLWHDSPFIEAPWCSYSGEVDVIRVYSSLEERVGHVHFSEYLSLPTVSEYVIDAGKGKIISHCVTVKLSVVIYPPGVNS